MTEFIELGVLWSPREGAKSLASGFVNREGIDALLDIWPKGEDQVRVFIQKIKSSSPRAPQYRITAVNGEGEVRDHRERGDSSRRGHSASNDRAGGNRDRGERAESSHRRDRDDRADEKPTGFDREQGFKATDDDVPF